MLYVDKYADAIEGLCSLYFQKGSENYENLRNTLLGLIEDIIRAELGIED